MPERSVGVTREIAADAGAVWQVLRDFARASHPWITGMQVERSSTGAPIRAFTVRGEPQTYRERLTWLSDSDRSLAYTHLEGIAGCEHYAAELSVSASDTGARVSWEARITAPEPRLTAICEGTAAVFEAGIAALASARAEPEMPREVTGHRATATRMVQGNPRLALTVAGGPGKRLCLFLHGIGGNRGNWQRQLSAVAGVMPAAAMDLRGYGDSAPAARQSTVEDYCDDILRVMAAEGAERLVLVGLSYGSWIATSFAMRHPDLLDGLVLAGGCTGMSEAGAAEREAFRLSREVPLAAGKTPRDFAPAVVDLLAGPNATREEREELFASMAAIPVATYRDALTCFTNPPGRFDFARLDMPVLMMTGAHDRLAPPVEIRSVARRIHATSPHPDLRFEVIEDAGHLCNIAQPATFNRHLLAFLRRLP